MSEVFIVTPDYNLFAQLLQRAGPMAHLKGLQMLRPLHQTHQGSVLCAESWALSQTYGIESEGKGDLEGCIFTKLHGQLQCGL